MSAFDLDEQGQARVDEWASANLLTDAPPEKPGMFDGALEATGSGIMRGGAKAADFLMTFLGKQPAMSEQQERTNELADTLQDEQVKSAVDLWTPNANEVGKVGQVLGGFSEMVLPLLASAGDPAILIGTNTLAAGKEQIDAGVDGTTASINGAITGASTYAGFKMPFLGKSLTAKMVSGALGNTAINAATTAAQREILQAGGYDDLAQQYDPFDVEARTIDLLTGVAFGGVDYLGSRAFTPSQVGAIAAAANAKHFQTDTAPGHPANLRDSVVHQEAMEASIEQLLAGESVAVPVQVAEADFIPRPETAPVEIPEELVALDEARAPDMVKSETPVEGEGYDVAEGVLTDEQLAQFQGLRSEVQADEVVGGPREGTPADEGRGDVGGTRGEPLRVYRGAARELAAEDFKSEALGHATGHPSSGLGVFFTNAAGDAARYGPVSEHFLDVRNPKVISVEDLPGFDSLAEANAFRKALEAEGHDGMVIDASHLGGPVNYVAFAHEQVKQAPKSAVSSDVRLDDPAKRDAIEALRGDIGLSERGGQLIRDAAGNATGRTSHIGSPLWMDRPGGEGGQITARSALSALDRVKAGKPLGAAQQRFIKYALDELDAIDDARTEYVNEAGARDLPPDVVAAQEYLLGNDLLIPTGELDAEGAPVTRSARELMAEADAEIAQAEADGVGYEAAVSCFLSRGFDAR